MAAGVQPALNSVAQMGSAAAAQAQAGLHSVAPGVVPAPVTTTNTSANPGVDTSHDLTPHSPTTAKLDHFLETRPKQEELQQKNILKGAAGDVLAGKKADLERAQLGTKLEGHLAHRPDPQVLVNEGILTRESCAGVSRDELTRVLIAGEAPPTK